eukprot:m.28264 g.28264  ORF g.28264 m.28264 type:complete len:1021 (+) comp9030_c0_seq2:170-3232(+)
MGVPKPKTASRKSKHGSKCASKVKSEPSSMNEASNDVPSPYSPSPYASPYQSPLVGSRTLVDATSTAPQTHQSAMASTMSASPTFPALGAAKPNTAAHSGSVGGSGGATKKGSGPTQPNSTPRTRTKKSFVRRVDRRTIEARRRKLARVLHDRDIPWMSPCLANAIKQQKKATLPEAPAVASAPISRLAGAQVQHTLRSASPNATRTSITPTPQRSNPMSTTSTPTGSRPSSPLVIASGATPPARGSSSLASRPSSSGAGSTVPAHKPSSRASRNAQQPASQDPESSDPEEGKDNDPLFTEEYDSDIKAKLTQYWQTGWEEGLSESDDDSDGESHDWLAGQDRCSLEEMLLRKKAHLQKLLQLYENQQRHITRRLTDARIRYLASGDAKLTPIPTPFHKGGRGINAKKRSARPPPPGYDLNDNSPASVSSLTHKTSYDLMTHIKQLQRAASARAHSVGHAHPHHASKFLCCFQPSYMPPCHRPTLPYSRMCSLHILHDSKQQLYKCCIYVSENGIRCTQPVLKFEDPPVCRDHLTLYDIRSNPRVSSRVPDHVFPVYESVQEEVLGSGLDEALNQLWSQGAEAERTEPAQPQLSLEHIRSDLERQLQSDSGAAAEDTETAAVASKTDNSDAAATMSSKQSQANSASQAFQASQTTVAAGAALTESNAAQSQTRSDPASSIPPSTGEVAMPVATTTAAAMKVGNPNATSVASRASASIEQTTDKSAVNQASTKAGLEQPDAHSTTTLGINSISKADGASSSISTFSAPVVDQSISGEETGLQSTPPTRVIAFEGNTTLPGKGKEETDREIVHDHARNDAMKDQEEAEPVKVAETKSSEPQHRAIADTSQQTSPLDLAQSDTQVATLISMALSVPRQSDDVLAFKDMSHSELQREISRIEKETMIIESSLGIGVQGVDSSDEDDDEDDEEDDDEDDDESDAEAGKPTTSSGEKDGDHKLMVKTTHASGVGADKALCPKSDQSPGATTPTKSPAKRVASTPKSQPKGVSSPPSSPKKSKRHPP